MNPNPATPTSNGPPPAIKTSDDGVYECIGICLADPASGLCEGCGRPLAEPQWLVDTAAEPPATAITPTKAAGE